MKLDKVICKTAEVDVSAYIDGEEKAVFTVKQYSQKVQNKLSELSLKGKDVTYNPVTQKPDFTKIKIDNDADTANETLYTKFLGGVESTPFEEKWNKETIDILCDRNPEMMENVLESIEEFNRPFQDRKLKKLEKQQETPSAASDSSPTKKNIG